MIRLEVLFFGHYSDFAEGKPLSLEMPTGSTLGELIECLAERDRRLQALARHCRFAVNEEYAGLETALQEGDTVAVLPPMSGG